jgi:gamma-glutamyltranspeptidase
LTHTLGTAAGVVTPGLGFYYNNSMKLFDPMPGVMSRAHVISTIGGRVRGGADPRGGAAVGYAW